MNANDQNDSPDVPTTETSEASTDVAVIDTTEHTSDAPDDVTDDDTDTETGESHPQSTEGDTAVTESADVEPDDLATPEGVALALARAGDAVAPESEAGLRSLFDAVQDALLATRDYVGGYVNVTEKRHALGEAAANLRRWVLTPSGPDWGATTDAYQRVFNVPFKAAFPDRVAGKPMTSQARSRELTNVRAMVDRYYREIAIRAYVRETFEDMPGVDDPDTDAFKRKVAAEYERCELTVPVAYLTIEAAAARARAKGGSTPPTGGPDNPQETIRNALGLLSQVTAQAEALHLLAGISAFALRVSNPHDGNVNDRPAVAIIAGRINAVAYYAEKALKNAATPDDREAIAGELYDPAKDVLPS